MDFSIGRIAVGSPFRGRLTWDVVIVCPVGAGWHCVRDPRVPLRSTPGFRRAPRCGWGVGGLWVRYWPVGFIGSWELAPPLRDEEWRASGLSPRAVDEGTRTRTPTRSDGGLGRGCGSSTSAEGSPIPIPIATPTRRSLGDRGCSQLQQVTKTMRSRSASGSLPPESAQLIVPAAPPPEHTPPVLESHDRLQHSATSRLPSPRPMGI